VTDPRKDRAVAAYLAGHTLREIGKREGVHNDTVRKWLQQRGLSRRRRGQQQRPQRYDADLVAAWVADYQAGKSISAIAQQYNVSSTTVHRHLHRQGVSMRPAAPQRKVSDELVNRWVKEYLGGDSFEAIAQRHRVGTMTVHRYLRGQGIQAHQRGKDA
jgi:transposase